MDVILLLNIHQHVSAIHLSVFRVVRTRKRIQLKSIYVTSGIKIMGFNQKYCTLNYEMIETRFNYICILVFTTLKMVT